MPASPSSPAAASGPRVRPVPAVSRALAILRLLADQSEPRPLKTIAQELGMVTSTCLHILRVLVEEKMVRVDPSTKRYSLDVGVLALARSVVDHNPFPVLVQPLLDRLSETWHVTTLGVKVTGIDDLVVLALARSRAPFQLYVEVGSRFPALTSATGRLVAAYASFTDAELARRFKGLSWDNPPDFATWRQDIDAVRQQGFSIDRGNYMSGITVVAVPVFDTQQRMTHALVALGVSDQLHDPRASDLAEGLRQAAQSLPGLPGDPY